MMKSNALELFLIKLIAGQKLKGPWGLTISAMNFAGLLPEPSQGLSPRADEILTASVRMGPQQCCEVQRDLRDCGALLLRQGAAARENANKPKIFPVVLYV